MKDSSKMLKNYKELSVWQKSYKLCLHIYKVTQRFPKDDGRKTTLEYVRFLF